ncbi:rhodanese-like domain-containing protein [Fusibacter ferrireducens]|uniref:Rhodanese-like domain-containing protein n=1 Tax=Fusibacter ferrireducens TaxID=2785058 RepID=A0ABR9ZSR9_9FIRM|nr:rhodanese-like domain-containing protein [Fusibacter ferrireducens]MBF4693517.1 rhodanese-like domain-containing protein [Fusibacter ferrireducens]
MNTKKITAIITVFLIVVLVFSGCTDSARTSEDTSEQIEALNESKSNSESESLSESESDTESGEVIYERIAPEDAKQMLDEGTVFLVDVRTKEEYAEGHIAGSVNIPVDVIESEISNHVSDETQPIMVYCRSGSRSAMAADALNKLGYKVVYDLGGIQSWPYDIEK